jgi:hypothetical protein
MASSGQQPAASSAPREARADRLPPAGANPTGAAGADHSPLRGVAVGHGKRPIHPAIERFLATAPVAGFIDYLNTGGRLLRDMPIGTRGDHPIGTRLKRTRSGNKHRKKFDYGIVMYMRDFGIEYTVLWMRDEAVLDPEYYSIGEEWHRLASYKNAFRSADASAGELGIPQAATFEQLVGYWCVPLPLPPAAAAFAARAALRRMAGHLTRARPARLHAGGPPGERVRHRPPSLPLCPRRELQRARSIAAGCRLAVL